MFRFIKNLFNYLFKEDDGSISIIKVISTLEPGYVAMDKDGRWYWYKLKPIRKCDCWMPSYNYMDYIDDIQHENLSCTRRIKRASNWKKSLIEIKGE